MDKKTLAKRIEPIDQNVSQIVLAENSNIKLIDTPFFKEGNVYLVSQFAQTNMIEIYIGLIGENWTGLISGNSEKYFEFATKAGFNLINSNARLDYLINYLEITKSGGERFRVLESIDDIKQRPNLDENQKEEFASFQDKYKSIIKPLKQLESGNYKTYLIKGQDLVEYELNIKEDNSIEKKETILEKDLLIPYAL